MASPDGRQHKVIVCLSTQGQQEPWPNRLDFGEQMCARAGPFLWTIPGICTSLTRNLSLIQERALPAARTA